MWEGGGGWCKVILSIAYSNQKENCEELGSSLSHDHLKQDIKLDWLLCSNISVKPKKDKYVYVFLILVHRPTSAWIQSFRGWAHPGRVGRACFLPFSSSVSVLIHWLRLPHKPLLPHNSWPAEGLQGLAETVVLLNLDYAIKPHFINY
jgi:hypothetical protein